MEEKLKEASGAVPALTAQQMLEKSIVPVKPEFLIRKAPSQKPATAAPPPASEDGAAPPPPSSAGTGGPKQPREQEQSKNKSRKQMRKDFRTGRQAELCTNFALGRCTFGDKCKFSHDVAEYIKSKPADLPGTCPSTAVGATCPYGITCRYARTHGSDDEVHKLLVSIPEAGPDGADGGPPAVPEEGGAPASSPAALADPPCALPLPASIEKESNVMSKEVQTMLWKNRYDFAKADSILKSMNLRMSFKHQPKPLSGAGGGGRGKTGAAGAAEAEASATGPEAAPPVEGEPSLETAAEVQAEAMQTDTDPAPTAQGNAESGAAAAEGDGADGPAAKRQRTGDAARVPTSDATPVPGGDAPMPGAATSDTAAIAALGAEQSVTAAGAAAAAVERPAGGSSPGRSAAAVSEARAAHVDVPLRPSELRRPDFRAKTYLAPLTTVGNLPFRRVCKNLGVDVTCGEMALATNLLQGQASEWALLKRHPCEDFFGVQVCGGYPDALARVGQLLGERVEVDFVDINMGCPIDLVCDKNAGSALLRQPRRIEQILRATSAALGDTPLTFKTRKGYNDGEDVAHTFLHKTPEWGAAAVTLHGRTRQQRYSKLADWEYIKRCGSSCSAAGLQLIGNGDVFSYLDWNEHMDGAGGSLASIMIGRGALIKPWIFTEIKEQRHWDISASERLDLYKQFCSTGLEHWGSDGRGVETTRRFLLEWLSFTCRYVPVGLLEIVPQQMNQRPPAFCGRSDLETLLASEDPQDWVRISEMLLGPPPSPISFAAKHKSNAYAAPGAASELDMARG